MRSVGRSNETGMGSGLWVWALGWGMGHGARSTEHGIGSEGDAFSAGIKASISNMLVGLDDPSRGEPTARAGCR